MNIKISTNVSDEYKEPSIIINAPAMTEEIQNIVQYISNVNGIPNKILANKNDEIYFIDLNKVICFFSKDKNNYVRIREGIYKIKYKLYELEENLSSKEFIRISKSCIINMNQVKCFDTSVLGTILVKMEDNSSEIVSKRNIPQIMKLLSERGNLK